MSPDMSFRAARELGEFLLNLEARRAAKWGFTIFRTFYGPDTDAAFETIVDAISKGVRTSVMCYAQPDHGMDNDPELEALCGRVLAAFDLRVEDDKKTLEGMSIDQLRGLVRTREPREEFPELDEIMTSDMEKRGVRLGEMGVFLVADEQVLQAVHRADQAGRDPWIKVVDVNYEPEDYGPSRMGPQRYFGWMIAATRSIWAMWSDLEGMAMSEIALPSRLDGRVIDIWDGASMMNPQTIEF